MNLMNTPLGVAITTLRHQRHHAVVAKTMLTSLDQDESRLKELVEQGAKIAEAVENDLAERLNNVKAYVATHFEWNAHERSKELLYQSLCVHIDALDRAIEILSKPVGYVFDSGHATKFFENEEDMRTYIEDELLDGADPDNIDDLTDEFKVRPVLNLSASVVATAEVQEVSSATDVSHISEYNADIASYKVYRNSTEMCDCESLSEALDVIKEMINDEEVDPSDITLERVFAKNIDFEVSDRKITVTFEF